MLAFSERAEAHVENLWPASVVVSSRSSAVSGWCGDMRVSAVGCVLVCGGGHRKGADRVPLSRNHSLTDGQ